MRTLVLGGSVFVGRHLVQRLHADGHHVTVLNRGRTPAALPEGVGRLVADRTDLDAMGRALAGTEWDVVFDVSGFVMAAGGADVEGLLDLFEPRSGRYVYVSSVMAYDQSLLGVVPWTEDMPTNPAGPATYGGFKAVVEAALLGRFRERRFPVTIVRPAAIYGPDNNIFDMETPMWLRLLQRRPVFVPHSGLVTGSYGHVDDLCDALVTLATSPSAVGEVFNVTAEAVTTRRYVETLAAIVGVEPLIVELSDAELAVLERPPFGHLFGRAHHAVLSADKAARLAGVRPSIDFRAGHEQTYSWFRSRGWDQLQGPLQDPLWRASWDFDWEEEVAARFALDRR
ncbi:MAG TPA: NAD-dependent epimerase/dehydratase family protein [Acidimicrobiales bacterium]|nr:NAD-dependent epimerase/dehydratase family protein [Acidimicrobiales bacterium]